MILVTADEMRAMDRRTIETFGIPGRVLMESAGRGAAEFLLEQFPDIGARNVAVVAGRGNNGGDGHVIARCLAQRDIAVTVYLLAERSRVSGEAGENLGLLTEMGVPVEEVPDGDAFDAAKAAMRRHDLWIDAILGTGLKSDVKGFFRDVIEFINNSEHPVFAVDVPSGLDSDTGRICGSCIRASATATFAFAKTGHFIHPGASLRGVLRIVDIGVPPHIVAEVAPKQFLLTTSWIQAVLRPRAPDIHKGKTGHLLVAAGATGKTGAASMTAMGAMRSGAGLVTLAVPAALNAILETLLTEVMTVPLEDQGSGILKAPAAKILLELAEGKNALALGPGIGQSAETRQAVRALVSECRTPLVIDADGLNLLADDTSVLRHRKSATILTPHPGEMARLTGGSVADIQSDRVGCARRFAEDHRVHLVLKGANTVIAHPDGSVYLNSTGNAGMASGGMGDVLTGMIAGFLAQGYSPDAAANIGVYLHGAAADSLAESVGPYGYIATDVMQQIPVEIGRITSCKQPALTWNETIERIF
ncbi:MAG TPA: NAD(P)H-hydrate dehydratase [Desulfobacterales bacterium]